jgi:hypothetical protein
MPVTETPFVVKSRAANFTVGPGDFGAIHMITASGVTATLPTPAEGNKGAWLEFYLTVDEDFIISCSEGLVVDNNATADTITWGQTGEQIGNSCRVISDGTGWLVQLHLADEANSQTIGDS